VEALAAALDATPAQLDQLRWRAGLAPRGSGAPGQDDPTLTLVAEVLGSPSLTDAARDRLRQGIAQAVQQVQSPAVDRFPSAVLPSSSPSAAPPIAPPIAPPAPILSPDAPPDPRSTLLAGLAGGWQTLDEAAAELRVTGPYLLSLVQAGQLKAWMLPGGQPGSLTGLRVRREDVLALLQPVRV
jgi:excisionase family DNA binding protein